MSASTHSIPLNIECFMNDIDVRGNMDRAKFEELIASDLASFEKTLKVIKAMTVSIIAVGRDAPDIPPAG
jgi:molecular chaperone DnaK (HSP70)